MKPSAKKKNCTKFEPQTWRPNRCKNCFKSPAQHPDSEAAQPDATEDTDAKVSDVAASASAKPSADGGKARVAGQRAASPGEQADQPARTTPDGNTPGRDKNTTGSASSEPPQQPASDSKPDHSVPDQGMRSQPSAPARPTTVSYVASHSPTNFAGPGAEAEGNGPASSPRGSDATLEPTRNGADWAGAGPNTLADISRSQVSPATPPESPSDGAPQDPNRARSFHLIRRQRSVESDDGGRRRRRRRESIEDVYGEMSREDALAEGTRLMLETLRDKLGVMEERCERLEREKSALGDLLAVRKAEFNERDLEHRGRLEQLEDRVIRVDAENDRLQGRLKLPENERHNLRDQENEIVDLRDKLEATECRAIQVVEDNTALQQEIQDLHLEMEEMHDQFRDDEALEFRELQKELEATAKNCRILQFKLRKADRRNELIESERVQYEEKIRQLERRFESDDKGPMRELEEELRMAKEVSVRLHDELEMVEERRIKAEDELARVQDYLRESETQRLALQQEAETLGDEVEQLREQLSKDDITKLEVPKERPMLRKIGSQGSKEYDVEQLMRDLSDHLERENDLKEQLNNAEAENDLQHKKMALLEEENESMSVQLKKMASARSSKYFKGEGKPVITEEAHEMSLQLELMDNEMSILRRKLGEVEKEKDELQAEVTFLRDKVAEREGSPLEDKSDDRPYDERLQAMAIDIDELKWKLIQKDQQVEKLIKSKDDSNKRATLKKSKSLDSDATLDIRKQLDLVQHEATILKEKVESLELQNDRLIMENQKLQMAARKVSKAAGGDSAIKNMELEDMVKELESENNKLKKKVQDKSDRLARLASGVKSREDVEFSRDVSANDDAVVALRAHIGALETRCAQIMAELCRASGKAESEWRRELSIEDDIRLADRIKDLECELQAVQEQVRGREEENDRLLEEINGYRDDIDSMMETFRGRERELLDENEMLGNKNRVITNLLDMVTERTAQSEGGGSSVTSTLSAKSEKDKERSASTVSALSDASVGSDEVFAHDRTNSTSKDIDEHFLRRIAWLEQLLEEEKNKSATVAHQANIQDARDQAAMTDDAKLFEREKEILQKELSLCQKQLTETTDLVKDLKVRLANVESAREEVRRDFEKATKDLERERQHRLDRMLEEEKQKAEAEAATIKAATASKRMSTGSIREKEPASWRWEKQEMERSIKEWKKKADDLDSKLRRHQTKLKATGGDKGKEEKLKEDVDKLKSERDKLKEEREKFRGQAEQYETTMKEIQETLGRKSNQWETERDIFESDKKAAEKEIGQKDEIIKSKDEIISQKDVLVKQKEVALKEREESLNMKENILKAKEEEQTKKTELFKSKEEDYVKTKDLLQCKEELVIDLEAKLKVLNENMKSCDERILEKDEAIEKLNKGVAEKESRANIMEKSMNEANEKLRDKDAELDEIKGVADDYAKKAQMFEEQLRDLEENLNKVQRERDKETAALVIQREKLENQLEYITKEKKCLDDEIHLLRKTLEEKETDWTRQKSKYETDVAKMKEKIVSLEKLHASQESEVMKELVADKESLMKDRGRLEDVIRKLRSELEKCREAQAEEVSELRKVLYESKKKLDEKGREVSRLQLEVASLKEQLGVAFRGGSSLSETPDPSLVTSPSISLSPHSPLSPDASFEAPDFSGAMERQELLFRAEKIGMEELYEARLRVLQEQLSHAHVELTNMKSEVLTQKELLQQSGKTLSEFKNKYDIDTTSWNEERTVLEKKAEEGVFHKKQHDETEKSIERIALKLRDEQIKRHDSQNQLTLEKNTNEAVVAGLKEEIRELKKALGRDVDASSSVKECRAILENIKVLVKGIREEVSSHTDGHNAELKALTEKLEQARRDWERERKDLEDLNTKVEERNRTLTPLQRNLIDMQYRLHSHREAWLRERTELQKQVDEARRSQLEEKEKFVEMISEVKRVKALMPSLEAQGAAPSSQRPGSSNSETHRSETVIKLSSKSSSSSSTSVMIDEALERIIQLAEGLTQEPRRRTNKSRAPPAFRRSLSSSEAEAELAMQQQAALESTPHGDLERLERSDWQRRSAPPSSLSATKRLDQMLRVKSLDRSPSPEEEEEEEQEVRVTGKPPSIYYPDGRSRTAVRRQHSSGSGDQSSFATGSLERSTRRSKRSSMHSSGTQSAYSSRDASPEKGVRRSPYPAPPPSFFITPPRSPRHFEPSPHCSILTSSNMMKLYAKLGAIDRHPSTESVGSEASVMGVSASAAIAQERTAALRVLCKSASVDAADDDPFWRYSGMILPENMTSIEQKKRSKTFQDAPLSETLPASIRMGELIITPGIEKLCKGLVPSIRKGVTSPKGNRKHATSMSEDTEEPPPRQAMLTRSKSVEPGPSIYAVVKPKTERFAMRMLPFLSRAGSEDKDVELSKKERGKSPKPGFITSILDRKKMFNTKRSVSVEASSSGGISSAIKSSIAKAGVQAATPGAPSTYDPPPIELATPKSDETKSHKRTTSLDFHSVFRTSRKSSPEPGGAERGRKESKKKDKKRDSSKARDDSKSKKKDKKRDSSKARDASEEGTKKKKRDSSKSGRESSGERDSKAKEKKKKKDKDKDKEKTKESGKKDRGLGGSMSSLVASKLSGVGSARALSAASPCMERVLHLADDPDAAGNKSRSTSHLDRTKNLGPSLAQMRADFFSSLAVASPQESPPHPPSRDNNDKSDSAVYNETSV